MKLYQTHMDLILTFKTTWTHFYSNFIQIAGGNLLFFLTYNTYFNLKNINWVYSMTYYDFKYFYLYLI